MGDRFDELLNAYWHCETRDHESGSDLQQSLDRGRSSISTDEFVGRLDKAIQEKTYSVPQYEKLIGLDFDTDEEVAEDLRLFRDMIRGVRSYE